MTRLQAAMKESSPRRQALALSKVGYRCGSVFKGCAFCAITEEVETKSGGFVLRYLTGLNIYRAYDPQFSGFTWWCYDCGAKDLACWAPDALGLVEAELGKPPVQGVRSVKAGRKYQLRKELVRMAARATAPVVGTRAAEVAALSEKIRQLEIKIRGGN